MFNSWFIHCCQDGDSSERSDLIPTPACPRQSPTRGLCPKPKGRSLREATATPARTMPAAAACMFMAAIKPCLPTSTASSMTSTATTSTVGHGSSSHTHTYTHRWDPVWSCEWHVLLLIFQVYFERERFSTVFALCCASQWHSAHLWWEHT